MSTRTQGPAEQPVAEPASATDWIALHVFYASDANPIVTEAVRPLVAELRAQGLIDGWFFIKYWMEGPHLRIRLHPSSPQVHGQVLSRAEERLAQFLRRRPALYDTDVDGLDEVYKKLYLAEYGQERWDETYGRDGRMLYRPNNSVAVLPYEQEFGRYGGPEGVRIAEWHFEKSSDLVATLLTMTNTQIRPLLLGLGGQLSLMTAYSFLETDERVARFFRRYRAFWETSYQEPSEGLHESFGKSLVLARESLAERAARARDAVAGGLDTLSEIERDWLQHCAELRERVSAASAAGQLRFPGQAPTGEDLHTVLLSSYIHMTNNRLGVSILDEVYLSYLFEHSLSEPDADVAA